MGKEAKIEHARFIIGRYDHYYESINSKSMFYTGLLTAVTGVVIGIYTVYPLKFHWIEYALLCGALLFALVAGILLMFIASPYLRNIRKATSIDSLIFFGSVSKTNLKEYHDLFHAQTDKETLNDMVNQIHILSKGLHMKYGLLGWCTLSIFIETILTTLLAYNIIK